MILIAMNFTGAFLLWRKKLFSSVLFLKLLVISVILPHIANQSRWLTAEVGRQPWIVYGLLRTSEGLSKFVKASMVLTSLIMLAVIYIMLFVLFIYLLDKKIRGGPEELAETAPHHLAE